MREGDCPAKDTRTGAQRAPAAGRGRYGAPTLSHSFHADVIG